MPRIPKVTLFSCHASHAKDAKETSRLFRNLLRHVKQARPTATPPQADQIVVEILNRTFLINLTPAGELQYDDPNVQRIEEITQKRIFWTFAFDPPHTQRTVKTRNLNGNLLELQHAITYAVLHTLEEFSSQGLVVLYTTAPEPAPPVPADAIYSLIEIPNPNIHPSNVWDARTVLYQQFGGDVAAFINFLVSFNRHTRFYLSVAPDALSNADTFSLLSNVYRRLQEKLMEIDRTVSSLREHSNELTYFSPNAEEVTRSMVPSLQSNEFPQHPFLQHSVVMTGYGLLCGPDVILKRGHGEIQTYRKIQGYELRFPQISLAQQIYHHFAGWVQNLRLGNLEDGSLPEIASYVGVIHACNRCDTEHSDEEDHGGYCSCFLDIPVLIERKGRTYKEDPSTKRIVSFL